MTQQAENDATETLGCIYCGSTITWPVAQVYPSQCLHCGRWPGAYTARATSPNEGLPDCEGWTCQSCGADNFIPDGFARHASPEVGDR